MNKYDAIAVKIIKEQESIIGPVAWYEAGKVSGIQIIDQATGNVSIANNDDSKLVVDKLVGQYESLFGKAAREVCKEAVLALIADLSPSEVPSSLK